MHQPEDNPESKTIAQIKVKALTLVNAGKLHEAIDSVTFGLGHRPELIEKVQLPYDIIFALDEKDMVRVKQIAGKLANAENADETAIEDAVKSIFEDYSEYLRSNAKMSFIFGMAYELKGDPNLSQQRVVEWINDRLPL